MRKSELKKIIGKTIIFDSLPGIFPPTFNTFISHTDHVAYFRNQISKCEWGYGITAFIKDLNTNNLKIT